MVYRVIGCMSGSSMDGLDIVYCVLSEAGGKWQYELEAATTEAFDETWQKRFLSLHTISAKELLQFHAEFGHYIGQRIQLFIESHQLHHKVHFVCSHGHTVFHEPVRNGQSKMGMTFQLGDGASIAAVLQLPVISDLRNLDVACGGQGAPIVPMAERLLWNGYEYFLNIGGIANIAYHENNHVIAFDVAPANRVLNALVQSVDLAYDAEGQLSASGRCDGELLAKLNNLDYYQQPPPKSLANEYGLQVLLPLIQQSSLPLKDQLCTLTEHIAMQVMNTCKQSGKMLVSGGGAHNDYLMKRIKYYCGLRNVEVEKADKLTIDFKEAIAMALLGALRWREEENVLATVTGASINTIGGALWMGRN